VSLVGEGARGQVLCFGQEDVAASGGVMLGSGDTIPIAVAQEAIGSCPRPGDARSRDAGNLWGHVFDLGQEGVLSLGGGRLVVRARVRSTDARPGSDTSGWLALRQIKC